MRSVLAAVNYLHNNKIMHRDLKPENILLESNSDYSQIKIIDFGASKKFTDEEPVHTEFVGTVNFVSPELIDRAHNYKTDVWSCGVIAYVLLAGQLPFWEESDEELFKKIKNGQYNFDDDIWQGISLIGKKFLQKLLEVDHSKRPNAQKAVKDLWITKSHAPMLQGDIHCKTTVAFENIIKFNQFSKMKQMVYSFLLSQQVSKKERESYRLVFQQIDTENNGVLSQREFINATDKFFGESLTLEQAQNLFLKADTNNDGVISFDEFVLASMD